MNDAMKSKKVSSIVLVDDDEIFNFVNEKIIRKYHAEAQIKSYLNPLEALEAIRIAPPDLIFLDINMPLMNGWEFLEAMDRHGIDCEVLILSSSIDKKDIEKAESYSRVSGYISKPLTLDSLSKYIAPR